MNSLFLALSGLILFGLGYHFYASFISYKIYSIQEIKDQVPAVEFEDGIDFVPTKKEILFGHHFTSIAGAAPIIGPCIAVYWGWLPAILWVIIGTIFMGAVHDFGALTICLKEKGKSIADISAKVINKRIRIMFLCFVMCLTWLVLAVFAMAISKLFTLYRTCCSRLIIGNPTGDTYWWGRYARCDFTPEFLFWARRRRRTLRKNKRKTKYI